MLLPYMSLGGPLMWPLLACSVLLGAVLLERFYSVVIRHKLLGRALPEASRWHHRTTLGFFMEVPPSLGLLGTVLGVVKSFGLVEGRVDTQAMAAGLSVACMTTVFGLVIAIVATIGRYALDLIAGPSPAQDAEARVGGTRVG